MRSGARWRKGGRAGRVVVTAAILTLGILSAACRQSPSPTPSTPFSAPEGVSTPRTVETIETTATPVPTAELLRDFAMPIPGGCLPRGDQLMPNARRDYRNGVHEGVDFYASDNCNRQITRGTEVLAAKQGRVIRADQAYQDIDTQKVALFYGRSDDEALDAFRGRQVWIDHGGGIVTRYCHLSGIGPDIQEGAMVTSGRLVGFVGESGTPESVVAPGSEYHLHFEVRVGGSFLGKGLPPDEVRDLYVRLFQP